MKKLILFSVMAMLFSSDPLALAQTKTAPPVKKTMMEPSAEQREKMAAVHEKMAACLRSTKPMGDCKNEMMQLCSESMGAEGCPMMDHKKMMHGRD